MMENTPNWDPGFQLRKYLCFPPPRFHLRAKVKIGGSFAVELARVGGASSEAGASGDLIKGEQGGD